MYLNTYQYLVDEAMFTRVLCVCVLCVCVHACVCVCCRCGPEPSSVWLLAFLLRCLNPVVTLCQMQPWC